MRQSIAVLIPFVLGICGCCSHAKTQMPATSQPAKPITVDDLRRGVVGDLEVPLGTVVEIRGKVVPNTTNEKEYSGEPFFLKVEQVNEKRLTYPTRFRGTDLLDGEFAALGLNLPHLKIGDSLDFFAYETGGYGGVPFEAFEYGMPLVATNGFHFIRHLVILPRRPASN
jgi:hypothetical protein